ncbi:MAG TPA: amidohydrolase [Niabella sp.]|nr:amidohydrolase [Niabella sp.]
MRYLFAGFLMIVFGSCQFQNRADLLVYNAAIYTGDAAFSVAEAMVIKDGKIVETGKLSDLEKKYTAKEKLNVEGKFIYPGFIDAHAHFVGYALGLQKLDLVGTNSWEEILEKCKHRDRELGADEWLVGRGWDQNDWQVKNFPSNEKLNELFPDRPVYLTRIDGHAAIANAKALELAEVKPGDDIEGGTFETKNGKLTGVLIDNAMNTVAGVIPQADKQQLEEALSVAQKNCFAVGLTTIVDAGLDHETIELIDTLQKEGKLKMRIFAMLSDSKKNYDWLKTRGKIKTDFLNVRAFKVYGDGALGSRGACLLQDYSDRPGWRGFLLSSIAHFDSVAKVIAENEWQMCTHAIGDSGNRTMLTIYSKYLKGKNDKRWRIEHAQVINRDDFHYFGDNNIIPSVQPTHATSDMYWAGQRLGLVRVKGAYAYRQLLGQNGWIALGTDFPVEDISTFKTFFAAVARKDAKGFPEGGFQPENALSREQTLRGMTIWAAKANFEEQEKGSLEKGKTADFIILDKDIMQTSENELLGIQTLKTFVGGQLVYEKNK